MSSKNLSDRFVDSKMLAVSIQVRHTSRIWLFMAAVSFFAVTATASDQEEIVFLNAVMNQKTFYLSCAILITVLYVAFCSAYTQTTRAWGIYHAYLNANKEFFAGRFFESGFKNEDVAHILYTPEFHRVYPLVVYMDGRPISQTVVYIFFKLFGFLVFMVTPSIAIGAGRSSETPLFIGT